MPKLHVKTPNALWIFKWLLDLDHKLSQIPYSKHILIPKILPNLTYSFVLACQNGSEEMVKYIVEFMVTNSYRELDTSDGFCKSIESGHLTIATYLLNIANNKRILIIDSNSFLKRAILNNDLPMAKWIVSTCEELNVFIDLHENEDEIFTTACERNNIEIAEWLIELGESDPYERFDLICVIMEQSL